jgi:glycosyltransferase involved in cell wall biosynthesis
MKPVLIITYYWPPSGGSGVQRWLKFSKYLPEYGYEPIILTVDPKYASYPVIDESLVEDIPEGTKVFKTKSFEVFNLYKKSLGKGQYPHSSFINEPDPSLFQKMARFIRGNFFIPDSRIGWKRFAFQEAQKIISQYSVNHVITTGPPHSAHLIGLELKKKTGIKWIADFRDPWTDIFFYDDFYHMKWARRKDARLELAVLENADHIIIVSQALKDLLLKKSNRLPQEKVRVIPNGFDETDFKMASNPPQEAFVITFTGSLANEAGKMDLLVESLSEVMKDNPGLLLKFKLIGNIAENVSALFQQHGIAHILDLFPYTPHHEAVNHLLNGTACFSVIKRTEKNKGILSGKIFDYIGSRKPIICIGPEDGNVAEILKECNAGRVLDYENKAGQKQYLQTLFDRWKVNKNLDNRDQNYLRYTRRNQAKQLADILND